jgi:hypothetical protein
MISIDFEGVFKGQNGLWLPKEVGLYCPRISMRKHVVFDKDIWDRYGRHSITKDSAPKWHNPYDKSLKVSFKLRTYTYLEQLQNLIVTSQGTLVYDTATDLQVLKSINASERLIDVSRLVEVKLGQKVTLHTALLAFGVRHERRSLHNPFADAMYTYKLWEKLQSPESDS